MVRDPRQHHGALFLDALAAERISLSLGIVDLRDRAGGAVTFPGLPERALNASAFESGSPCSQAFEPLGELLGRGGQTEVSAPVLVA